MAAKMLVNAEKAGKKVTAGNVAYYTIQHLKSGRRSVGNSKADALATGTQKVGNNSPKGAFAYQPRVQPWEFGPHPRVLKERRIEGQGPPFNITKSPKGWAMPARAAPWDSCQTDLRVLKEPRILYCRIAIPRRNYAAFFQNA
jgi:hypothetical protein